MEHILQPVRAYLKEQGLGAMAIFMADPFQNEYVADHYNRIQWLSGFTGSAGSLVITSSSAVLFTDGRYRIQAPQEVDQSFFEVRSHGLHAMADFLKEQGVERVGYDGWTTTVHQKQKLEELGFQWIAVDQTPLDSLWHERPKKPWSPLKPHDIEFSGRSSKDKRGHLANLLKAKSLKAYLLTLGDSIAWVLNIRGGDLDHTPLAYCYGILEEDGFFHLFIDREKVTPDVHDFLGEEVKLHSLEHIESFIKGLDSLGFDPRHTPVALESAMKGMGHIMGDPTLLPKACKNATEQDGARHCHRVDGIAMTRFLHFLSTRPLSDGLDEQKASKILRTLREDKTHYQGDSFSTISAAGPNAALCHYHANDQTNRPLKSGELYLVDSGGQYLNGTTDVTRTVLVGGVATDSMKGHYTRVLKGHIALATARFPKGTTGTQLDGFARRSLWDVGLDFSHSTGHGVGSYLSVHEGPQAITPRLSSTPLKPGMILSNEPGYYLEGHYGIRLENLILVKESDAYAGFLEFENLTWVPFDKRLIQPSLLNEKEVAWLEWYHEMLIDKIGPGLSAQEKEWLQSA